jgi:predicted Zn-dependent protease
MKIHHIISFVSIFIFCLFSCAVNPVTGKKQLSLMSEKQEIALGAQNDPLIIANFGLYPDSLLQQFINDKGKQMAAISHRSNLDYKFRILDSPVINAFAVPGGYVYFTRGIMAHFNNEAEFAGVLGHEIGHIAAKHSATQYTKQTLAQVLFIGGLIVSPELRGMANELQQGMGLLFLKFSRDNESQSDVLGVNYSTQIGYNSHYMADFFQVLARKGANSESGRIPGFLSTHPDPANRYDRVHELSDEIQKEVDVSTLKVNRNEYLNKLNGLVYGEDPRQGYVEKNRFYHPVMKFQFPIPKNWKTINSPLQVQMGSDDGKAMMIFTLSPEKELEKAAQSVIEEFKLQVVQDQRTTINGFESYGMITDQVSDQQQQQGSQNSALSIQSFFIKYGENIFIFHGVSTKADFSKYESVFDDTMYNFKRLTDPTKINVKPDRIRIRKAPRSGTLSQVFASLRVPSDKREEMSILNGMELNENVSAGTLIKTITQ